MTGSHAEVPLSLWVTVLPGDDLDAGYLRALSAGQRLPVRGVLLPTGQAPPPWLAQQHTECQVLSVFEPTDHGDGCSTHYWAAIASAMNDDLAAALIVRAGTAVPALGWNRLLSDLEKVCSLRSPSEAGTVVFPLSCRSPLSGVFASTDHAPGLEAGQLDHWLNNYAPGLLAELPAPGGYSGLMARGKEPDKLRFLISDALFVDDHHLAEVPLPTGFYAAYEAAFAGRHPLTGVRHALTQLSSRGEIPPFSVPAVQPVMLHVGHGWGGGLARWIEDFTAADHHARSLVLRPIGDRTAYGQTIALYDASVPARPLRTITLTTPILSTAVAHAEYALFLKHIIGDFNVGALLVSSLIGHAMDVLETDLPTLVVSHDFFPTCPAIVATFDTPCTSCSRDRLEQCLRENPLQQFFKVESAEHWHAVRAAFEAAVARGGLQFVAPSESVRRRLTLLTQALHENDIQIIGHGLPAPVAEALTGCRVWAAQAVTAAAVEGDVYRPLAVVLGSAESHKGSALLHSLCDALAHQCDFLLLGFGDAIDDLPAMEHVTVLPRYDRQKLAEILSLHKPDLGLLLSTVPETFSYTLSELWAAAIPVLATNVGAFEDRISHGLDGWLVAAESEAINSQLAALCSNPAKLQAARARLLEDGVRTALEMVEDYYALLPLRAVAASARPLREHAQADLEQTNTLYVDTEARYADAFRDFLAYSKRKFMASPRVPGPLQRFAARILR